MQELDKRGWIAAMKACESEKEEERKQAYRDVCHVIRVIAYRLLNAPLNASIESADDIVQTVMLKMLCQSIRRRLAAAERPQSYVRSVVARAITDKHRNAKERAATAPSRRSEHWSWLGRKQNGSAAGFRGRHSW